MKIGSNGFDINLRSGDYKSLSQYFYNLYENIYIRMIKN